MATIMTTEQMAQFLTSNNYRIEQAHSGHYYLTRDNEDGTNDLIWSDSACEDLYDYDSAVYMFYCHVTE